MYKELQGLKVGRKGRWEEKVRDILRFRRMALGGKFEIVKVPQKLLVPTTRTLKRSAPPHKPRRSLPRLHVEPSS